MRPVIAPMCPDDGATAVLRDDAVVYGRSFGRVWICPTPGCRRYVGAHPDGRPKGTLADNATRRARRAAHEVFDDWWKRQGIPRGRAYRELASRMGVEIAHIGEMDVRDCERVMALFSAAAQAIEEGRAW